MSTFWAARAGPAGVAGEAGVVRSRWTRPTTNADLPVPSKSDFTDWKPELAAGSAGLAVFWTE